MPSLEPFQRAIAPVISPFFRVYPYRGAMPITRADARGAVSEADRFFYNRTPKVANSTIMESLARASAARQGVDVGAHPKGFFARPSKVSSAVARAIPEGYFKFVFTRDPTTRTLSAYLDKIGKGSRKHLYAAWAKRVGSVEDPSFEQFLEYLADGGLYDDPHWAPQTDCLLIPLENFDFVGRFERLGEDLPHVLNRVFDAEKPVHRAGPSSKGKTIVEAHMTPRATTLLGQLFAHDYEAMGYPAP
ncbi:MAG: sulfotransferase family protein [Pseudomonadota bacterium]